MHNRVVAGSSPAGPTIFKQTGDYVSDLEISTYDLVKPDREPDFVLGLWEFFFTEMVQLQASEQRLYKMRVSRTKNELLWFNERYCNWNTYEQDGGESDAVWSAYMDWHVHSILLR